jgi:hypothetical protein
VTIVQFIVAPVALHVNSKSFPIWLEPKAEDVIPTWYEPEGAELGHLGMIVHMLRDQLVTLDQIRASLDGTSDATFSPATSDADRYQLIASVLCRFVAFSTYEHIAPCREN